MILESPDGKSFTVPRHSEIRPGTLLVIIEEAGLTKEEFLKLLG
jgi:predicted RNA binding protein YcfA (HicA-like mRNA interferase family)